MILCLDTSTSYIAVWLIEDGKIIYQNIHQGRSQELFNYLPDPDKLKNLEKIIVGMGPGSFTGLRIGITFAKTLSMARKIPLAGVPSLACFDSDLPIYARSRKGEFYELRGGVIDVIEESMMKKPSIGPVYAEMGETDFKKILPDPFKMIELADFNQDINEVRPIYMRGSYAEEKRAGRRG